MNNTIFYPQKIQKYQNSVTHLQTNHYAMRHSEQSIQHVQLKCLNWCTAITANFKISTITVSLKQNYKIVSFTLVINV